MLRWMAPFLSFTAEEAWTVFAGEKSQWLDLLRDLLALRPSPNEALLAKWERHPRQIRDVANKEIETVRTEGQAGFVACRPRWLITAGADDAALAAQRWATT
jgi:isoleucyl-tRNA synthetase